MDDSASWESGLELLSTSGGDVGGVNVEFLQGGEFGKVSDRRIGDRQVMEPELLEFGQLGQLADGLVSNPGFPEIEAFEVGEFGKMWSTGVSDGVPSQA